MSVLSRRPRRGVTVAAAVSLAAGILGIYAGVGIAGDGLPADKTAVGGSGIEDMNPNTTSEVLSQRMKVSSPADLILGVTSECTILTRLMTNNTTKSATTTGSVVLHITIDGNVVPVETFPTRDDGSVTFCNRTYQRTVSDDEGDTKVDKQEDYIRTRTANAFNWVALNVGVDEPDGGYDDLANGNNIVDVRVFATYIGGRQESGCVVGTTCSTAYVGKRSIVIEPVHAAVNEQSEPIGAPPIGQGGL